MDGIGIFTHLTLKSMVKSHPEDHFIFFFDRIPDEEFIYGENVTPLVLPPKTRHPLLTLYWLNFVVKPILEKFDADVFLSPDGNLILNTRIPQLPVIHDLNFEHLPQHLNFSNRNYYRTFFRKYAHVANRIATVSEFSKQDISRTYKIESNKIDVVYNGVNSLFKPVDERIHDEVKEKYTDKTPFFIFIGSIHPRKNIVGMLKAFNLFREKYNKPFKFLISGNRYHWTDDMQQTLLAMKYKQDVVFTGRCNDDELIKITGSAACMLYVPFFEGFGIPLLEAMYAEVPVIASNSTSIPEVAKDAALYVNPMDVEEMANAMEKIVTDKELRSRLIEKGRERRTFFNSEKTAHLLYESILKVIKKLQ